MRTHTSVIFLFLAFFSTQAEDLKKQLVKKTIISWKDTTTMNFVRDSSLYTDGWDTLQQTIFWKDVIRLTSDTCVINVAYCRKPVNKINSISWMSQTETEKLCFKDSVC